MSIDKNYYVICGYDLTDFKTEKYNDWKWTEQGEEYTNYQRKGKIQLFDDPMNSAYLYLGYILAAGDEYSFDTVRFDMRDVSEGCHKVEDELIKLSKMGIVKNASIISSKFQIIVFEECT